MKRCPVCQRVESDDALRFCRIDGSILTDDSTRQLHPLTQATSDQLDADTSKTRLFSTTGSDASVLSPASGISPLPSRRASRKAIDSLAVLPFMNASDDAEMDYLSDGVTESIM